MQNYVLSDVLTKVGYCFSGGYGICICRNAFDGGHPLIDGRVTRQILHVQGSGAERDRVQRRSNVSLIETSFCATENHGVNIPVRVPSL
jgi:hypothetical protein